MISKLIKRMLIITCCLLVGVGGFGKMVCKRKPDRKPAYYAMHIEHSKGTHPDFAMVETI